MTSRITKQLLICVILIAVTVSASADPEAFDFQVTPQKLGIGLFFAGRDVKLSGSADASLEIAVEVFGPEEKGRFHLKGEVGPLWMNLEDVELGHAPHLYLLLISENVAAGEDLVGLGVGLKHVENKLVVRPDNLDKEMILEEFLKLKRSQGLYDERPGAVNYGSVIDGFRSFHATFRLPSSTAPGIYEILVTSISADGTISCTTREFRVEEVGVIKTIHDFAFGHGLLYGIFCVVIALAVGGTMGVFFRRSGGH
jgi:hypothetical protein